MMEFILAVVIFACGGFVGFIAAAIFVVGSRADEEFDGGFRVENAPVVRTVRWNDRAASNQRE